LCLSDPFNLYSLSLSSKRTMIRPPTRRSSNNRSYRGLAQLDMYRKVPIDLLEGTKRGSIVSWMALIIMTTLVILETKSYFTSTLIKELSLDSSPSSGDDDSNNRSRMKVFFNITMMDLRCEFATIDVVSFLGKEQNVTKYITKVALDARGVQQEYVQHRNPMQHDIELSDESVTQSIEELHENGEHAIPLTEESFEYALGEYDFVYVDFFASWCSHCQIFAPTWEHLAELMDEAADKEVQYHTEGYISSSSKNKTKEEEDLLFELKENLRPALVAKVDCVLHHDFCMRQSIAGYPSIRLFAHGKYYGDYWGHRNILGLTQFLKVAEEISSPSDTTISSAEEFISSSKNISSDQRQWAEKVERKRHHHNLAWDPSEHPGCQLSGSLLLDRTPGNFYIQAQSPNHDLNPSLTNVSHMVEYLSFTKPNRNEFMQKEFSRGSFLLGDSRVRSYFSRQIFQPMNKNVYVTEGLHEAYHHYMKLVSTNLNFYQVLSNSQLTYYTESAVPEAKFMLDISPIKVTYTRGTRAWYDYITSLMAILGGTFTVVGMLNSALRILMTTSARHTVGKRRPLSS